jgi:epoxide hydrolase-like predicted phosphatase
VGRLADLDVVTLDANGTLVGLVDPVPKLDRILRERGVERPEPVIRRAFEAEGTVYAARSVEAHEPVAFAALQRECTGVFLAELGADELDADEFAPSYAGSMEFKLLSGAREAPEYLRSCGIELAVVANFDLTLTDWLERLGLASLFSVIVTPADAGAAKPDAAIFELTCTRLGLEPADCVFVDDLRENCAAAEALGMAAILHRGADSTIPELERLLGLELR